MGLGILLDRRCFFSSRPYSIFWQVYKGILQDIDLFPGQRPTWKMSPLPDSIPLSIYNSGRTSSPDKVLNKNKLYADSLFEPIRPQIITKTNCNNGKLPPKCFSLQMLACLDTFAEPRRVVIAVRTKWTQCCFVGGQDLDGLGNTLTTCPALGANASQTRSFTRRPYHMFQKAFATNIRTYYLMFAEVDFGHTGAMLGCIEAIPTFIEAASGSFNTIWLF